jgi:hypothetical protein
MCTHVVVIGHARHVLNHNAKQQKAVIGIGPFRTGLECQAARTVQLDIVCELASFEPVLIILGREDIAGTTGVSQELADGDFGGDVLFG